MSEDFFPRGLPEHITNGNTLYYLSRVGDRAFYIPHGYLIEDELYCWCVKTDSQSGRTFFSNCGGLGNCWDLPDVFSESHRLAIAKLRSSNSQTVSSPPSLSTLTHTSSSRAFTVLDERTPQPGPAREIFSLSSPSPRHEPVPPSPSTPPVNIYAGEMAYLRAFDSTDGAPPPRSTAADETPQVRQLRESVGAYADEVAELRGQLKEERRLALEKDMALVEVEEWMVSMRLRMMDALKRYRQNKLFH